MGGWTWSIKHVLNGLMRYVNESLKPRMKFGKSRELWSVNDIIKYLDYIGYKTNAM